MNVIDLFSGVGGLSLGASRAGFNVALAVEIDPQAIETHAINFPFSKHLREDVSTLTAQKIIECVGVENSIDGIVGGPPCQGFSSIGKGDPNDERNKLYMHFFRLVSEISPRFFVAENVPGIMQKKYDSIRNNALSLVRDNYFLLDPLTIKASEYGAPTTRTRVFFIGIHRSLGIDPLTKLCFSPPSVEPIHVEDALWGLPDHIDETKQSSNEGWLKINRGRIGHFHERLWGHVPVNVGDVEALENIKKSLVSGFIGTQHSETVKTRYGNLRHGETDKISRSVRLDPRGFCPTLRAGTGSDKGSFQAVRPIHPTEDRVITPREAARLQGFPDWFRFHKTKWHSFRQIGNSVSPIVAEFVLNKLYNLMLSKIVQPLDLYDDPLKARV